MSIIEAVKHFCRIRYKVIDDPEYKHLKFLLYKKYFFWPFPFYLNAYETLEEAKVRIKREKMKKPVVYKE